MRILAMPNGRPLETPGVRILLGDGVDVRVDVREPASGVLEIAIRYDDPENRGARLAIHPRAANVLDAEIWIESAPPSPRPFEVLAGATPLAERSLQVVADAGRIGLALREGPRSGVRIGLETLLDDPLPDPGSCFSAPMLFLMPRAANLLVAGYRRTSHVAPP